MAVSLLSRVGVGGWVVITRFKAKSQFKLDLTVTELELSLAMKCNENNIAVLYQNLRVKLIEILKMSHRHIFEKCHLFPGDSVNKSFRLPFCIW